jgi:fluoroquinolone transport system ATP-binding protein
MITVENLAFTYPGGRDQAVKGLSFEIKAGEIFGFLGPSGAGKSTTQKILIGLLKGYQGSITVMGRPLSAWGSDYYEQIGVGFELPNHYLKLTALENLNYFRALYSRDTEDPKALLAMVGLADDADTPVGQFSKGMKMRLNFARALLHRPSLLFLDEPTSGLDPVNSRIVRDIIRQKQAQGTTIFLTTHDMMVADELSDRVAFIVDGVIQALDTPKALKLRYGRRSVQVEYLNGGSGLASREFELDGLGKNPEFLDVLRTYRVETIHTQETTLENIFIQVTGRELAS